MKKQKIKILGEQINYINENNGRKKVLFIHGFNSSIAFANSIIYSENRDFDIVAFDMPGSGGSTSNNLININLFREITKAFVQILDLKDILVVSHSLGSASALAINNHPYVKYTILLSPFNYIPISENFKKILFSWLLPDNQNEAVESLNSLVKSPPTKDYKKNILKQASAFLTLLTNKKSIFHNMVKEEILNFKYQKNEVKKWYKDAKNIEIISGADDKFIPFFNLEIISKELNISLYKILNCGHAIIFEHSKIIERKIKKAIEKYL